MVAPPREWKNYLYLNFIVFTTLLLKLFFIKRYWINKGIQTVAPPVECKTKEFMQYSILLANNKMLKIDVRTANRL